MAEPPSPEWTIVGLMAFGFGLVGIDRLLISPPLPTIAREVDLNRSDIGTMAGTLPRAWGFAALVIGNISDRLKTRWSMGHGQ